MYAKVEGLIDSGNYLAEKIVVDSRDKKDEDKDDDEVSPTVSISPIITATPTTSVEPTTSVSPSPNISLSPTATETPILQGNNNNAFTLDQLILKLEKLIRSLLKLSE